MIWKFKIWGISKFPKLWGNFYYFGKFLKCPLRASQVAHSPPSHLTIFFLPSLLLSHTLSLISLFKNGLWLNFHHWCLLRPYAPAQEEAGVLKRKTLRVRLVIVAKWEWLSEWNGIGMLILFCYLIVLLELIAEWLFLCLVNCGMKWN